MGRSPAADDLTLGVADGAVLYRAPATSWPDCTQEGGRVSGSITHGTCGGHGRVSDEYHSWNTWACE